MSQCLLPQLLNDSSAESHDRRRGASVASLAFLPVDLFLLLALVEVVENLRGETGKLGVRISRDLPVLFPFTCCQPSQEFNQVQSQSQSSIAHRMLDWLASALALARQAHCRLPLQFTTTVSMKENTVRFCGLHTDLPAKWCNGPGRISSLRNIVRL